LYDVLKARVPAGTVKDVRFPVSPFVKVFVVSYTVTLSDTLLILQKVEKCVDPVYWETKAAEVIVGTLSKVLFVSGSRLTVTVAGALTNSDSLTVRVTILLDTVVAATLVRVQRYL